MMTSLFWKLLLEGHTPSMNSSETSAMQRKGTVATTGWNPFPWCPSLPCKKQGLFPPLAILNYQVLNFWENKLFFLATMAISIGFASPQQHPLQWPSLDFDPRHLLNHGWEGTNRTRTQMFKNTLQQGLMKVMKVMKVFKSNFLQIKDDHRSDEI